MLAELAGRASVLLRQGVVEGKRINLTGSSRSWVRSAFEVRTEEASGWRLSWRRRPLMGASIRRRGQRKSVDRIPEKRLSCGPTFRLTGQDGSAALHSSMTMGFEGCRFAERTYSKSQMRRQTILSTYRCVDFWSGETKDGQCEYEVLARK